MEVVCFVFEVYLSGALFSNYITIMEYTLTKPPSIAVKLIHLFLENKFRTTEIEKIILAKNTIIHIFSAFAIL